MVVYTNISSNWLKSDLLLPQALPGMTTSVHLRKFIFHLQTLLQTLADPSNKHNRKPTSRCINARQLRNINTMRCFRIYQCFFFSNPRFPLPRFLHFRPSPGCAVWYRRHPLAAREWPGRRVDGQATREDCGRLARRASAFPSPRGRSYGCGPLSHFTSSSVSPRYLWRSPTTLLLQSDLKLPRVPKPSIPLMAAI